MDISDFLDERDLADAFGAATVQRGRDYHLAGRVRACAVTDANPGIALVQGRVEGSGARAYDVTVTLVRDPGRPWLDARCTCPVLRMCKHAVALLLRAGEDSDRGGLEEWEARLAHVLDELGSSDRAAPVDRRPLALQVELTSPGAGGYRWDPAPARRGLLRLRPLIRGAREGWVKTGVSWSALPGRGSLADPRQVALLHEILSALRSGTRLPYYVTEASLPLADAGPSLWRLLAEAHDAGLALVPAGALATVTVAPEPVEVRVDVNGADLPEAHLSVGVTYDGRWHTGSEVEVLGETGHGVVLWTPDAESRAPAHARGRGRDHVARAPSQWHAVLARLVTPAGPQTRRLLASGEDLRVPAARVPDLVADYLPRLRRHLPVGSSDESVRIPEPAEPRLALTVTWKSVDEVHLSWSWRYRVGADDRIFGLDETRGLAGIRRPEEEQAIVESLDLDAEQRHRLCGARRPEHGPLPEQTLRGAVVVAFTEDTLVPLEESAQVEIEEIGARPSFHELTEAPVIRFAERAEAGGEGARDQHTDWLDLEVVVTVGAHQIGLVQLLEALTLGAERIVLRGGAHLRIDRPEFEQLTALVRDARELVEQPSDGVRVHRHDLGLWNELDELGLVARQASQWLDAARSLRDLEGLPEVEPSVEADLRGYQHDGLRWLVMLWERGLGGILADDMGLGKTMQTLALVAHARATARARGKAGTGDPGGGDPGPFLVVAPTSVVATWAHEASRFAPQLRVRAVTESRSRRGISLSDVHDGADLVITSYTLFRLEVDSYVELGWGGLVLDEAQTVKNHTGKTHQCVRRLEVPFRLALTGTPMENRLMELWSLLSIVAPGLYPYPQRFTEMVANPVEREGDAEVLARFQRRIKPFVLRRTKDLVATDLPPKQEQVLEVRLTPRHRRIYDTHLQRERQNVLGLLGDFERQRMAIFRSLTRLRQLSLDAALVDPAYDGIGSAKIDALVDHLQEVVAEGHRALVFSQFTSFLTRVRRRLDAEGIESRYLDGRTRRRAEVVGDFKRGAGAVFLISLKAGGVGLTLTEADYVFVLDPWWNPAVEAQAVDRAHRIGQSRPVMVYRLVAEGTIEEKVMELKARKAALFAQVLDGGGAAGSPITPDDVRALLEG